MSALWNDAACRVVEKRRQAVALQTKGLPGALTENHTAMPPNHRIAFVSEILHAGGASLFLADLAGELNRGSCPCAFSRAH